MLICPDCNFENPNSNNFCQKCGTSLTHTICQKCGMDIPLQDSECSACGASNKILLLGIIVSKNQDVESAGDAPELALVNVTSNKEESIVDIDSSPNLQNQDPKNLFLQQDQTHLDSEQRYTIEKIASDLISSMHSGWNLVQVQVTDEYPLKLSFLKQLQQKQPELFDELGQNLDSSYLSMAEYWNMVGIPTIAIPYLLLKNRYPIVPQLYDAWQEEKQGVVLIEDRSHWQLLNEIWSQPDSDLLQLLWSLDEIAKLWTPLSEMGCATSLFIETNLLLDEDQSFCLQQLYLDNPDSPPKLVDLVSKLQDWLDNTSVDFHEQISPVLQEAIAENIESIEQFRQKMQELIATSQNSESKVSDRPDNQAIEFNYHDSFAEFSDFSLFSDDNELKDSNLIPDSSIYNNSDSDEQPTALLPMDIDNIDHASCTDIGIQRDHNEDFFGIKTTVINRENSNSKVLEVRNLYIVCDGMGGHAAGEVASAMAVDSLQKYFQANWTNEFPDEVTIRDGILQANQILCEINSNNSRSGSGRMGTTLVMALIQDTQLAIAHVGDSRIYRVTKQHDLEQLTVDHEVGQREINRGVEPEIAYGRPDAYQLTQALGPRDNRHLKPSISFFEIQESCLLLLCSDGLSDNKLLEKHGESYLKPLISSKADLESGLSELIDFANHYNGHDNITAIAVRIRVKPNL